MDWMLIAFVGVPAASLIVTGIAAWVVLGNKWD
jgi:hypothetical protein